MLEPPPSRILDRRETAAYLLDRRPDLAVDRTQRRRARELCDALGNRRGVLDVLGAWLEANPDADVRELSSALTDRVQLRLASVPARERSDKAVVAARVEEAFGLGWEHLPTAGCSELLFVLAEAMGGPIPPSVALLAAEAEQSELTTVLRAGFLMEVEEGLALDGATLGFVSHRPQRPTDRVERALRLVQAIRERAVGLPTEAPSLDALGWRARDLCAGLHQEGLIASLAHRLAECQRSRGDLGGALAWIEEGQRAARTLGPEGLAALGLLQLDEALVVLSAQGTTTARPHAARAVEVLQACVREGVGGADRVLRRARLLLLQIDAANRPEAPEAQLTAMVAELEREGGRASEGPRAVALQTLGSALIRRGAREEGRARLEQARVLFEATAGSDHRRMTPILIAEAQGLHSGFDTRPAEKLLERARVLGGGEMDRAPDRALPLALHELGLVAGDRGDRGGAAILLDEAAMLATSLLPAGDPVRATTAYSRGLLFLADGEHRRAEKNLDRANEGWRAAYPPDHPAQAIGRAALAWARARGGDMSPADAESELDAALRALAEVSGLDAGWLAQLHALRADLGALHH